MYNIISAVGVINAIDTAVLEDCLLIWSGPPTNEGGGSPCNGDCTLKMECAYIKAECWGKTNPNSPLLVSHCMLDRRLHGYDECIALGYNVFDIPAGKVDVMDIIHNKGSRFPPSLE